MSVMMRSDKKIPALTQAHKVLDQHINIAEQIKQVCVYVCEGEGRCVCVYVCVCLCACVCVCLCVCVCMCMCMCMCMHVLSPYASSDYEAYR